MRSLPRLLRTITASSLLGLLLVLAPAVARAQTMRTIAGVIIDAETHRPVTGATVVLDGRDLPVDASGRFTATTTGTSVTLTAVAPGHLPLTTVLNVEAHDATGVELLLAKEPVLTTTIDVVAAAPEVAPTAQQVSPLEVLHTAGSLDNIYRTLQTLPGVQATEEIGSRIAVRGGAPDQNLTVMDGVEIHDPYRLYGLTSAFNPETISSFEIATSGFSAKYGDRLSSLLTIENRDGRKDTALAGSAALSITDTNGVLEGRLPGVRSGSWLVAARRTYYDAIASKIVDQSFPGFNDIQTKVAWDLTDATKLSAFGLRSRQSAAIDINNDNGAGEFNDSTQNDLGWLKLRHLFGTRGFTQTTGAHSNSASTFGADISFDSKQLRSNSPVDEFGTVAFSFTRTLRVRDTSLRQEATWLAGGHTIEVGGEWHHLNTLLAYRLRGDRNPSVNGSSAQGGAGLPDLLESPAVSERRGAWLIDTWRRGRITGLESGLRVDHSTYTGQATLSPRLSMTVELPWHSRTVFAAGRYTQTPGYEKQVSGNYVLNFSSVNPRTLRAERADAVSARLEHDLPGAVTLRGDAYYKRFGDLLVGQLESDTARAARLATYAFPASLASEIPTAPLITTVPGNTATGRAYGVELLVTRTTVPASARLQGWASYAWGHTDRDAYGRRYAFEYNRAHAISGVGAYRLSRKWEVAATLRAASGFPRTPPVRVRAASIGDVADSNGNGSTTDRVPRLDPSGALLYTVDFGGVENLNSGALPVFFRLDGRVTWRPRGTAGRWEFYTEVLNVTNRKNVGTYTATLAYNPTGDRPRIVEKGDQSIPRLPTIGLRWRF